MPRDATRDCAALAMLPVLMLPVIVYNLISNFLQMQRKLDGTNSKRSHLHRWIKSVKILSDALMEDLKAATRKNEILFKNNYVLLNLYARITVCIMFHYCDSMFYGNNYTVYLFKEVKCLIFKYSLYISVPHFFGNFRYVPCLSARHPKLIQMV